MEIRRTPGYPLLLTLGVLADRIAAVTIAVQILLGMATVWMVALLARRVIGAGTGDASRFSLWAAAAYALDPLSILYPSLLLTRTSQLADPLEVEDDGLRTSAERLVDGGPQGPSVAVSVSS